jgi:cytochrome b subunit of formate dehydrogenase
MRSILLAAAMLASPAAWAEGASPEAAGPNQVCLDCHSAAKPGETDAVGREGVFPAAFERSVHKDLSCTDCHVGYEAPGPHELPPLSGKDAALVERLSRRSKAPRSYLACSACHDAMELLEKSVHGRWLAEDRPVAGPTCASCHGSPHAVARAEGKTDRERSASAEGRARARRCESCHDDPQFAASAGLKQDVGLTYRDSIHGRLVALGSSRAPGCSDCHGAHSIVSKTDAASPVAGTNRARTCGKCHSGATDTFAAVVSHRPLHVDRTSKVPHFVHVMFSWLTTLTLLFFAFHVSLDFVYELRLRLRKRKEHAPDPQALQTILRFDIHQRIQHWLMLTGVILLGLTGWPLRGAGSPEAIESSRKFLALFGGPHGAGLVHRFAAVMIMVSGAYHLFYLGFLASKKALPLSMAPVPKDALDMRDNILFMLGLKKERPQFERFMYLEKFDYWAVFWGIVMMVGSGFVFWFPVFFSRFLPSWILTAAQIIHGEEATLAILFLFTVHFYNVHLKPSIFPMNWAWLNGRITVEALREEHPLEYQRTFGKKGAP